MLLSKTKYIAILSCDQDIDFIGLIFSLMSVSRSVKKFIVVSIYNEVYINYTLF